MTTKQWCRKCGYTKNNSRPCIWCTGTRDSIDNFTGSDIVKMHNRFYKLEAKQKVLYVIALGIEGFKVDEIGIITNMESEYIKEILLKAQVCQK